MAQLVVLFPAQQNAGENVVNFAVFGIRQANYHLGKKVWIQVKIDVLLPVFSGIKQLRAAALLELQIEQNVNMKRSRTEVGRWRMLRQASRRKARWLEGQSRRNMRIHTIRKCIFNRQRNSLLFAIHGV